MIIVSAIIIITKVRIRIGFSVWERAREQGPKKVSVSRHVWMYKYCWKKFCYSCDCSDIMWTKAHFTIFFFVQWCGIVSFVITNKNFLSSLVGLLFIVINNSTKYAFKWFEVFLFMLFSAWYSDNPKPISVTLPDSETWILVSVASLWEIYNRWISLSLDLITLYTLYLSHSSDGISFLSIQIYAFGDQGGHSSIQGQ